MPNIQPNEVSCVIPYAGAERYLVEVVGSARVQQFHEIIIVNDGCPAAQLDPVAKLPGVRLIHLPKSVGCPNARNLGIRACTTRYLVLLDHDDLLCDGYFPAVAAWMGQHQLRCAAATLRYIGESSRRIGAVVSRNENFFLPSGFISEVSLLAEIGYFQDSIGDDLLFFRAIRRATRLTTCPEAGVLYRIHPRAESSLNTKSWWAFDRLLPCHDHGTHSLAEINDIAKEFARSGKVPASLEEKFRDARSSAARFLARSAYACWLNRDFIGLLKYGFKLAGHLPTATRLAANKWRRR